MIEVVVTSRRTEAQDICSYELASVDGNPLPPFSAANTRCAITRKSGTAM